MNEAGKLPEGFLVPSAHPELESQRIDWQRRNQSWWDANPMRYDWRESISAPEFSREFFEEIDRRHFADAARYTPFRQRPFDELIPYEDLRDSDVLEIGVGSGCHAQVIAPHCRSYTGIDLTATAVDTTRRRFNVFGIPGTIEQMDAESMSFPDESFDFIWTWGVIHHSSSTERVLQEMQRVLRPGGRAVIMVYHRSFLYYYFFNGFFRGVVLGGLRKHSLHELVQLHTDGAIARVFSSQDWRSLAGKYFQIDDLKIKGQKSELLPLPASPLKNFLIRSTPDAPVRLVLNKLRQGSFLISTVRKTI